MIIITSIVIIVGGLYILFPEPFNDIIQN
jgi:hypothetical protein